MSGIDTWCADCQTHQAAEPSGLCPVCAPNGDILQRIDDALAHAETMPAGAHQGDDMWEAPLNFALFAEVVERANQAMRVNAEAFARALAASWSIPPDRIVMHAELARTQQEAL